MTGGPPWNTIPALLAESPHDIADLSKRITASGILRPLAHLGTVLPTLTGDLARAVADALRFNLGDVIVQGWRIDRALHAAATATLPGTGPAQHVSLSEHTISSTHHPQIDVIIDEGPPLTITLTINLELGINALLLTVQRGRLVGLSPAGCRITAALAIGDITTPPRTRELALRELVTLNPGAPLLPPAAYTTTPHNPARPPLTTPIPQP
jgi:hypothetical protein